MPGYTISPERTGSRPAPDFAPPPAVGSKPQSAELDELYAAVRTIRAFCRGREHCVQDFGKDWCPIYRCCDLLPKDWPDEEERMQKG